MTIINKSDLNRYYTYSKTYKTLISLLTEKNKENIASELFCISNLLQQELNKENLSNKANVNTSDFIYSVTLLNEEKSHVIVKVKHKTIRYYNDTYFFEYFAVQ